MQKCFAVAGILVLVGVGHGGGVAKDVMAIKISVAGGINTKNAKVLTVYNDWLVDTQAEILKVYKERDDKVSTSTATQKKLLLSFTNIVSAKWNNVVDFNAGMKGYNKLAIDRVGQASLALLDNDLPLAIMKHKEAVGLQGSFARTFGMVDVESARLAAYIEDMKSLLKEIPYPMNMFDM